MVNTFSSYYNTAYDTVAPVVYSQPLSVVAPIVTPYLYPMPFYGTGFAWYNRFNYGAGFRPFWNVDRVSHFDRVSNVNVNRFPVREARNDFADRSRSTLQTAQRRGDFTQSRNLGKGITGGVGGYRGGISTPRAGARVGGGAGMGGGARMGGGRGGGGRGGGRR
jgi:hypothetical protein